MKGHLSLKEALMHDCHLWITAVCHMEMRAIKRVHSPADDVALVFSKTSAPVY